jgi:cation transport regulator ChaB
MYTINEKEKKNQPINTRKKLRKNKGAMFFALNPKTCTQYKDKTNQLTNKTRE